MSIDELITIKDFSYSYGNNQVLKNLTLSIKKNSIHGILGDNGTGKTTLFNCTFNNLRFPNKIIIRDNCEKSIAYLESDSFFYSYMTGREYLQIVSKKNDEYINKWNTLFDLPLNEYASSYSTGMRKKLSILGILLLKKEIVILDEPFNGLDFKSGETVNYALQRLKQTNRTILLSSHILETLTKNSDRISILENGGILKTFEKNEFKQLDELIAEKFGNNIREVVNDLIR